MNNIKMQGNNKMASSNDERNFRQLSFEKALPFDFGASIALSPANFRNTKTQQNETAKIGPGTHCKGN